MILERKCHVEEIRLRQKITLVTSGVQPCESDETSFKNKNSKIETIWKFKPVKTKQGSRLSS